MSALSENNKRIARNTLALYIRMAVTLLIGLYTSRIVLNVLGVEDYGTYNVVGGIVGMFTILTGSLSSSISRYLTFELGRKNLLQLNKVFSMSLNVLFFMSVVVVVVAEIVSVWFLNTQMKIPDERLNAANWVLQCSILTFVINLLVVPYNASILSHERMKIYAYISIWDVIAKLLIVFVLTLSPFDKLKSYTLLLLVVNVITTSIYVIYCRRNFEECHYRYIKDKMLFKDMTKYAGWAFLGDGSWVVNTQGVNILINIFFGVTVNAARGIAVTIDNLIQAFVRNFMVAINPQITKSYAVEDYEYMHKLIFMGAKYSYFIVLIFFIPIVFETRMILTLWLKIVPEYAVVFTQLTLASTLCMTLGGTLVTGISTTGDIKKYEIVVGTMALSNFPLTWVAFKLGASPIACYIIYLCIFFCLIFVRIQMAKDKIRISVKAFVQEVLLKAFYVAILAILLPWVLYMYMDASIERLFYMFFISIPCSITAIYFVGMNKREKEYMINILRQRIKI